MTTKNGDSGHQDQSIQGVHNVQCIQDDQEQESTNEVILHAEVQHLKQHLAERDAHISAFEAEFVKGNDRISHLEEQLNVWREKYDRLYDSHIRIQKVNQNLEDKLLQMVDKCAIDKTQLTQDVETLSVRLAESNYSIGNLAKENERYKNDMNLAIQLLQCKPDNFVSQKFDSLPIETQTRVSNYIMNKAKLNQEFIPTSDNKKSNEKINTDEYEFNISASLMSKILEESVQNTISKHCDTCACVNKSENPFSFKDTRYSIATQTIMKGDAVNSLCLNCNSDVNCSKNSLIKPCNSPLPIKIVVDPEKTDNGISLKNSSSPVYLVKHPPVRKYLDENKGPRPPENVSPISKPSFKCNEENLRLVNMKHKEIMKKIGNDLKGMNMNLNKEFPSIEPITGHHRLCDRTKYLKMNNASIAELNRKIEDDKVNVNIPESTVINTPPLPSHDNDLIYSHIEKSTSIPNSMNENKNSVPKSKSDLNIQKTKVPYNSSISSNDAESKTSSNLSSKNYESHSGSNSKVHIGPGPRFCSLRMQAGSKNILLDNAQPDIAPILYTRQSRLLDTSPPTEIPASIEDQLVQTEPIDPVGVFKSPSGPKTDNILDLPNDDLILDKPLEICEKPESGYKSNESAEIIDKLLFGDCTSIPNLKREDLVPSIKLPDVTPIPLVETNIKELLVPENVLPSNKNNDKKLPCNNITLFNFDHYESGLKNPIMTKIPTDRNTNLTFINSIDDINKKTDPDDLLIGEPVGELLNSNYNLSIASKNLSEINKKFSRIANPTQVDNLEPPEPCQPVKEWKKEASVEKSSSSLSSDDSAVVLQKQQLMRVAEWVQKNLEMEQQNDFDDTQVCNRSPEEMHHVRNDFPRPAKIDRPRKSHKLLHHGKHIQKSTSDCHNINSSQFTEGHDEEKNAEYEQEALPEKDTLSLNNQETLSISQHKLIQQSIASDLKNSNSDYAESNISNATSKSYTKEELARMEYNVKQFLLRGSKWTSANLEPEIESKRTSSKTETDL